MSHYFSLVGLQRGAFVHPDHRQNLQRLARTGPAYLDHCLIMQLFPGLRERFAGTDQTERATDFLFHRRTPSPQEQSSAGPQQLSWHVVSREEPVAVPGLLHVQSKSYEPVLHGGEPVRFQLRANPSVTRSRGGVPGSGGGVRRPQHDVLMLAKREAIRWPAPEQAAHMDAAASDWLLRRAPGCGLLVEPDSLILNAYTQHRIQRKGSPLSFSSIDYTGIARVSDPERLTHALLNGVGRKRGFGCGLLLVRRLD